jgi:pilus assembly protein CpaC
MMTRKLRLADRSRAGLARAGLALAIALCGGVASIAAEPGQPVAESAPPEVVVAAGKSRVIELPQNYAGLMIADPKIADVLPLNPHAIYLVGKTPGATALSIYGPGKRLLSAFDVVVSGDLEDLKRRLHELLPDERNVKVQPAADSIVLSGSASSPAALNQILTLAETYAPKKIVNMMTVEGTQQVMLTVRFVEMSRTVAKDLRVNLEGKGKIINAQGARSIVVNTGDSIVNATGQALDSFGTIAAGWRIGSGDLTVLIDALESKGLVRTLAEPTLVATSGDTANFLAGGEFPIPVSQSSSGSQVGFPTITVEFKQFGIALAFTPTLLRDGLINLVVNPEVSEIDEQNSVRTGGIIIPGLRVRRAHTTVELRDGESFTIAGLLSEDYSNTIRQYPFIGDIPVLGTLFRSTGFSRGETELVMVVTPHLATPRRGPTALPGEHFVPPSDFELFLLGSQTGEMSHLRPEDRALMSLDPSKGGVDGPHGHVLY